MVSKEHHFETRKRHRLAGILDLPSGRTPTSFALFAHCFTCGKDLGSTRDLAEALTERGIGVFRFDFPGLGASEGDFSETTFSSNIHDLEDAADFMSRTIATPQLLIGHSLGGAMVLKAAPHMESVRAVVAIAAPADPDHVAHLFTCHLDTIRQEGSAAVRIGPREFTIRKDFVDDVRQVELQSSLQELKKPLLLLHSPVDNIVGIENAGKLYEAALHPKSFISLDQADHLLSATEDAVYAGTVISAWASRYLNGIEANRPELD